MENKQDTRYFCILPLNLIQDGKISDKAKLLYGIISNLLTSKGYCYATNSYFEEILLCSKSTIQRSLKELAENFYIKIEIEKKQDGTYRKIFLLHPPKMKSPGSQKCDTGSVKNDTPKESEKKIIKKQIYKSNQSNKNNYNLNKANENENLTDSTDLDKNLTDLDKKRLASVKISTKKDYKELLLIINDIDDKSDFITFAVKEFVLNNNIELIRTSRVFFKQLKELKQKYLAFVKKKQESILEERKTKEYLEKIYKFDRSIIPSRETIENDIKELKAKIDKLELVDTS